MIKLFWMHVNRVSLLENVYMTIMKRFVSGRVPGDTTPNITRPIMPTQIFNWYNGSGSTLLTSLNPDLSPANVNTVCNSSFECVHDYLIRINRLTSGAVVNGLQVFEQAQIILGTVFI